MKNTRTFSDIDLNFTAHPVTGDVTKRTDLEALKASIKNLVLTSNFERPFHSELGSRLKNLMFEPITPMLNGIIKQEVTNLINTFEPRADLLNVVSTYYPDENNVSIDIIFRMNGTSLVTSTNVTLERTR